MSLSGEICNGHGKCLTMSKAASRFTGKYIGEGESSYTTPWDADKIQG